MQENELGRELTEMAERDLNVRDQLARSGKLSEGYHNAMRNVHDTNAARLAAIIDEHGWPGKSMVGQRAASAAWLVLQHSIGHPRLLKRCLKLIRGLPPGEVSDVEIAMLEDRILCFEGRPQLYGTQFDWDDDGKMSPLPYDDIQMVNQRRRSIGLPLLTDAIELKRKEAELYGEQPPANISEYRQKRLAFLYETGWASGELHRLGSIDRKV